MKISPTLRADLVSAIPRLRAFALGLSGNHDRADDLVQETLVRALDHLGSFEGTNVAPWLVTILRNAFYSDFRKRRREVADPDGMIVGRETVNPSQIGHMECLDLQSALQRLPAEQREALVLVAASGMSYEEAAALCECAIGTIKSRVSRGRSLLAKLMFISPEIERMVTDRRRSSALLDRRRAPRAHAHAS